MLRSSFASSTRGRLALSLAAIGATLSGVTTVGAIGACNSDDEAQSTLPADAAGPSADGATDAGNDAPDAAPAYTATILRTATFVNDGHSYPVSFVRIERPGGQTYVQWVHTDVPGTHGAVLATQPYAGIDWTGDALDTRWAATDPDAGLPLDVDGPEFDGQSRIVYERKTSEMVNQEAILNLVNGLSTLFVFGRFYAGGSVRDEIEDMKAGTWFLAEQADVDRTRIGVFGGSWGGFEALYAAAFADARITARAVAAAYPPADFPSWVTHLESRTEPALGAIAPHRRRIQAGVTNGDYTGLRYDDLCARLPEATFLLHDAEDNLVPIGQSKELASRCGADVLYWPRANGPDPSAATHGRLLAEVENVAVPTWFTYANAYLHLRLAAPGTTLIGFVEERALAAQLTNIRAAQVRAEDVSYALPRLRELLRFTFLTAETKSVATGPEVVSRAVNLAWGTTTTAGTIEGVLATGLPPP